MTERKVWVAFLLLALAWGTSFMFIKIAVQTVQPVSLVSIRLLIGWLCLAVIMRWQGLSLPRGARIWGHLFVIGVVNIAVPFVLIVWAESGQHGLDSGVASIINSAVPLFSILIAAVVLRMETVTAPKILGLLIGFAGVVVLLGRDSTGDWGSLLPYFAIMMATLCYAIGTNYARRYLQGIHPVVLATGQLLLADVVVFALALLIEDPRQQVFTGAAIASLVWLGIMGSCVAYILYFYILGAWGATRTTLVTYLLPVVGVAAGVLFLGESVDWKLFAGGLLILSGVGFVNWRPRHVRGNLTQRQSTG